jgi:hypothetical protein
MTSPLHDDRVFSKPSVPENTWKLLLWVFFEPILLEDYSATLSKKQTFAIFLWTYPSIVLISLAFFLVGCFVVAAVDIPTLFFEQYKIEFINHYLALTGLEKKFFFIIQQGIDELTGLLSRVLAIGFILGLFFWICIKAFCRNCFHACIRALLGT